MSGTLISNSPCKIELGESSCKTNPLLLTWEVTNPETLYGSAVTSASMQYDSKMLADSGTDVPVNTINGFDGIPYSDGSAAYPDTRFYLYNNGISLVGGEDGILVRGTCDTNLHWDGSKCALNTYTVSATAGANGSISPVSKTVNYGSTMTFAVTPSNTGYYPTVDSSSTCSGSLSGSGTNYTYTTSGNSQLMYSNCNFSISFGALDTTGTLKQNPPYSCSIPTGGNTCPNKLNLDWTTSNIPEGTTTSIQYNVNGVLHTVDVGSGSSGSQPFINIPYSNNSDNSITYNLVNNNATLKQSTITTNCASGSWDGSECSSSGSSSTKVDIKCNGNNPLTIVEGDTTPIDCTLKDPAVSADTKCSDSAGLDTSGSTTDAVLSSNPNSSISDTITCIPSGDNGTLKINVISKPGFKEN
jgi:hypothetical protein